MAITRQEDFARDEILPSWWANRIQDRIAAARFRLRRVSATTIEAVAGANDEASGLNVQGQWRFRETNVQRAHPGGAAGTYLVFVTAKAQAISNSPLPNTDNTDYAFDLAIVADGTTPAIVAGTVDVYRRVGRLTWDGAAITSLVQEVGSVGGAQLDDDVFAAGGDLVATRQPGGGFLLTAADNLATQAELDAHAALAGTAHIIPVVTTLPAMPVDGQEVYFLADAANGVVWHLKYRAADPSAYKWQVLSGAALFSEVVPGETRTNAAYGPLATAGPSIALPLAGDYDIDIGALAYASVPTQVFMSYAVGGAAAADADAASIDVNNNVENAYMVIQRRRRKPGLGAVSLIAQYRTPTGTGGWANRFMRALPVRVG